MNETKGTITALDGDYALVRIAGKQKKALKVEDFPVPAARTKKARAA